MKPLPLINADDRGSKPLAANQREKTRIEHLIACEPKARFTSLLVRMAVIFFSAEQEVRVRDLVTIF
jgi:hypothetical protein